MSKLIQKFKTIIPNTQVKVVFALLLLFSSCCLSFTFVNAFNLSSAWLTLLVTFAIGILLCALTIGIIFALPKFIKSNINIEQYYIIFTLLFAVEIFILSLCLFLMMLLSPLVFLFFGMALFIGITWFNIIFEYNYFAPLSEKSEQIILSIKLYNIIVVCVILFVWFII